MQTVSAQFVSAKVVLLRYDIDVPLLNSMVLDGFRLTAGLETLGLCLQNGKRVILMGNIGRPGGQEDNSLSIAAIHDWLMGQPEIKAHLQSGKLKLLENLRFEKGEEDCSLEYAHQLASLGEVFVNESFAAYRPSSSVTILPTLMPAVAGLRFSKEVEILTGVRENPRRPLVAILGGAKVEEKLPVIEAMSKIADIVLVGGKLVANIKGQMLRDNVFLAELNEWGTDITDQTVENWQIIINKAGQIIWNGPLGKVEDERNQNSKKIAEMIINSPALSLVGGGDTLGALKKWGLRDKFHFISTGGGAMLEFLTTGTLPTVEALGDI